MDENNLLDQIHAHRQLVAKTVNALVSADYLIYHLEDKSFSRRVPFLKALNRQFDILSLDEHENFIFLNRPYWELYKQLFLRYRKLNDNMNQSKSTS